MSIGRRKVCVLLKTDTDTFFFVGYRKRTIPYLKENEMVLKMLRAPWQSQSISSVTLICYRKSVLYWVKQLFAPNKLSSRLDVLFPLSTFFYNSGSKKSHENNSVRESLFLGEYNSCNKRNVLFEFDQQTLLGGTIDFGDS